jgi:hypothetical protein
LKSEIPCPIIRAKKFSIDVELIDAESKVVSNTNRLRFVLHLYTSDPVPAIIDEENSVLRYSLESQLKEGRGTVAKIQVNEVTSRYRNGWVYMWLGVEGSSTGEAGEVEAESVSPLVLKRLVVRSKEPRNNE